MKTKQVIDTIEQMRTNKINQPLDEYQEWLERQIEVTLEDNDLTRQHWAFCNAFLCELYPNLARAYEIALVGNLTIGIIYDEDYINGYEDYQTIKEFFNMVTFTNIEHADIIIKIYKPEPIQKKGGVNHDTLVSIHNRVGKAKGFNVEYYTLSDASNHLLNVATNRLNLSIKEQESVINIANIIAQTELSKTLKIEHVAEAIQYKSYRYYDKFITPENNMIHFGNITIPRTNISEIDINAAIEHLKSML